MTNAAETNAAEFDRARERMLQRQVVARGIVEPRVIRAMRETPREWFVNAGYERHAYDDTPLPIDEGQTISQPHIVARLLEAAELAPTDRVLEVGFGSGYLVALLSRLANEVVGIERFASFAAPAAERLAKLGRSNVELYISDGTQGLPRRAPFDAIIVSAAGASVPEALKAQLAIGGRLVIPVGEGYQQRLLKLRRVGDQNYEIEDLGPVTFVPLVSAGRGSDNT